jgi:hypothetical protein
MMIRLLSPALFAACVLLAAEANAAPATAFLETTSAAGAADCPKADTLAALVNEGLGRVALSTAATAAADAPLRVVVRFERAEKGYAATVNLGGGRGGTRKLSDGGPECAALANAVGVLLTVLLDSNVETLTDGPTGHATTATFAAGGGVAEGLVGGWSPTLGLGGALAYQRWSGRLGGVWLPAKSNAYGPGRVEIGLAFTRLALCMSVRDGGRARFALALCAQQQVGWLRGRGFAYDGGDRTADHLWLASGASIVASGSWERSFGWEIEAGAVRLLQ